jgi:hypothetical protein
MSLYPLALRHCRRGLSPRYLIEQGSGGFKPPFAESPRKSFT